MVVVVFFPCGGVLAAVVGANHLLISVLIAKENVFAVMLAHEKVKAVAFLDAALVCVFSPTTLVCE